MKAHATVKSTQVSIFYDGACPLCTREIAHYRKLDQDKQVCWIDISDRSMPLQQHGLDYDTAMSRLHVLDKRQTMRSGVPAFLTLWEVLPYYRWLARIIHVTRTAAILEWLYVRFARWRLARRNSDQHRSLTANQASTTATSSQENEHP